MGVRSANRWEPYDASDRKTFHSALCRLLHTEFPGVFGPTITRLFADRIAELHDQFHPPGSRFKMGQILWTAVAVDDPPSHNKRIEDTRLLPIVLDLVTAQDIGDAVGKKGWRRIRRARIVRLCRQAYDQKAVLSLADVSLLIGINLNMVSRDILAYERETGEMVPRRGTIHDMGPSVTHKAIICYKRLVERKSTSQVASETHHSADEVEYYVQCFRRVQLCHDKGMSKEDIARATSHSLPLVQQYLDLIKRFGLPFPMLEVRKERQLAGIANAKSDGKVWGGRKAGTRVKLTEEKEVAIRQLHQQGQSVAAIARTVGLTRKTIYRALGRELIGG